MSRTELTIDSFAAVWRDIGLSDGDVVRVDIDPDHVELTFALRDANGEYVIDSGEVLEATVTRKITNW